MPNSKSPSTRHPERLPTPERLESLFRALALLDEILEPDWNLRYFSYEPKWGAGGTLGSMRTGEGRHYEIWFSPNGTVISGTDPESRAARVAPAARVQQIFEQLPRPLGAARTQFDDATFAIWCTIRGAEWTSTPIAGGQDGSADLLWMLDDNPATYVAHARKYFDRRVAVDDVAKVYSGRIDAALVHRLNSDANVRRIVAIARKLGFKVSTAKAPARAKAAVPAEVKKRLKVLFDPAFLAKRLKTLSLIDAIVAPSKRAISVEAKGRAIVATIGGDEADLHVWLSGASGVLYGGDVHDAVLTAVPPAFEKRWRGGAPATEDCAFMAWTAGREWKVARYDSRAASALDVFQANYLAWARRHYGRTPSATAVTALWNLKPLTEDIVRELNPHARFASVAREAERMQWKVARRSS